MRYVRFGEGEYKAAEAAIRALSREAGGRPLGAAGARGHGSRRSATAPRPRPTSAAPARRASRRSGRGTARTITPPPARALPRSVRSLGGRWRVDRESARAVRDATISARIVDGAVYLMRSSDGGRSVPARSEGVHVDLDGRPIARDAAGADVHDGAMTVRDQRLPHLVRLDSPAEHVLTLRFDAGVSAFAFTFG